MILLTKSEWSEDNKLIGLNKIILTFHFKHINLTIEEPAKRAYELMEGAGKT